jgi:hypothetical protein
MIKLWKMIKFGKKFVNILIGSISVHLNKVIKFNIGNLDKVLDVCGNDVKIIDKRVK